jgi:hypothetical protein
MATWTETVAIWRGGEESATHKQGHTVTRRTDKIELNGPPTRGKRRERMNGVLSEGNVPRPLTSIQSSSGRFTRPLFTELLIFSYEKEGRRLPLTDGEWPLDATTSCIGRWTQVSVFVFHLILQNFIETLRRLRHLIRFEWMKLTFWLR